MAELLKAPFGSNRLKRGRDPVRYRLYNIKAKCKSKGIEFDLVPSDIVIPDNCPLLGTPLVKYTSEGNGAKDRELWSIDRKDPAKGYVKDNVWVISHRANAIKSDATLEELERLVANLKKI